MPIFRESPLYQEIIAECELNATRSLVIRLLTKRIGSLSPELQTQVKALSLDSTESLAEALLDFSQVQDLEDWLQDL